jgi:hypothetical protein
MTELKKYTQKEVGKNIEILEGKISELKLKRTEITLEINSNKKQVASWKELDLRQLKLL